MCQIFEPFGLILLLNLVILILEAELEMNSFFFAYSFFGTTALIRPLFLCFLSLFHFWGEIW